MEGAVREEFLPEYEVGEESLVSEDPSASQPLPPSRAAPRPEHVFRAAPMTLVQMYISREVARDAAGLLGAAGYVHFVDLNEGVSTFNRRFTSEIRRLDESLRLVRQLEAHTQMRPGANAVDVELLAEPLLSAAEVLDICELLAEDAERMATLVASYKRLTEKRDELLEERMILTKSQMFLGNRAVRRQGHRQGHRRRNSDEQHLLSAQDDSAFIDAEPSDTEFDIDDEDPEALGGSRAGAGRTARDGFLHPGAAASTGAGVGAGAGAGAALGPIALDMPGMTVLGGSIERVKSTALEQLCWRATRGNLFFTRYPIENQRKDVFMVYTHGQISSERVLRIAQSLDARVLVVDSSQRSQRISVVNDQLTELFAVLDSTEQTLRLEQELVASRLPAWKAVVVKEKAIYSALNLFSSDEGQQGLIAEGWIPTNDLEDMKEKAAALSARASQLVVVHTVQTSKTPPTYHTTNKVTAAFQLMVDVYGTARHGEVNPGLPTVVTFPFMFAVMFGDCGHGFIMLLAAVAMVVNEKKIERMRERNEIFDMAFSGRYVLLLMGLFSIFTGFIYNDLFSKSMTIFGSAWSWSHGNGSAERNGHKVYPIGMDWAWHGAENNLRFTNSYKMKLSILLGFVHMTYSLMFQYVNARHFDSWVDVWGNFVPSLIFMQSIFGYLSATIVYKWCVDWVGELRDPPGLLDMLIKMFLSPGTIDTPLYRGQAVIQIILLILALVCVPWLLLFKPLYLRRRLQTKKQSFMPLRLDEHTFAIDEEEEGTELQIHDSPDPEHEEAFGDIMIHQVIHTIEFCLNCISHTASYLRLWALSLAHNQLSIVLWNMTIQNAFGPTGAKGIIMVFFLFAMWFSITVLVLVCMEGTSAMLHALRLHWVEAMSKHFVGEGHPFKPFSFTSLVE